MSTKTKKLLLLIVVLFVGLVSFFLVQRYNSSFYRLTQEIYDLPTSTTAEDLERQGFLDLTDVQDGPIQKVESFFEVDAYFPQIFKTFTVTDEGLVIRIFQRHRTEKTVSMLTYLVQIQGAQNPNALYKLQPEVKTAIDGTQEVWLVGLDPATKQSNGYDHLLYRYQSE